ncbi:MAG TPA: cytochrome bc complex cytochrome b subunit [Thermoanaerobaculia bacterium]|nr:cytochrome bc complex cytochrome b subunit [Thermoanaerobaculia bacterium]
MSETPAAPSRLGSLLSWLEDRLGVDELMRLAKEKEVPQHRHSVWYYLGGMTLFLFVIQVATGILLLLYYRPSEKEAFESVQFLMSRVPFGWLVRSIHSWSANLLIFVLLVHMFSVFFLKAYRRPREATWVSGMVLFALMLGFGFSGYLLPWNKLAFFATQVGTEISGAVPVVGHFMVRLLRGGAQVTGGTLTRFYGVHVAILPALTTLWLLMHLLLVQRHGMSVPPKVESKGKLPFLPNFLLRDAIGWCAALAVLAALAAIFPWELGEKADPFSPAPAGIRPEWYFCFMFQTLKVLPGHILGVEGELVGLFAFTAGGLLWLLVPFIDKEPGDKRSRIVTAAGVLIVVYIAVFTLLAYRPGA